MTSDEAMTRPDQRQIRFYPRLAAFFALAFARSFIVPVLPSDETRRPYLLALGLMVLIALGLLLRPGAGIAGLHAGGRPA